MSVSLKEEENGARKQIETPIAATLGDGREVADRRYREVLPTEVRIYEYCGDADGMRVYRYTDSEPL